MVSDDGDWLWFNGALEVCCINTYAQDSLTFRKNWQKTHPGTIHPGIMALQTNKIIYKYDLITSYINNNAISESF